MKRDVFQAIADPTRREILKIVSKKSMNLNTVAEHFSISRPAISKHIKILTQSGLIIIKKKGREHYCMPNLKPLKDVAEWAKQFKELWNIKSDSMEDYIKESELKGKQKSKKKKHGKRK